MNVKEKILALDVGTKRVGVAISDEAGMIAFPEGTYERSAGKAEAAVIGLIITLSVKVVVAGLPLGENGERTFQCDDVERFCRRIGKRVSGLEILYFDEYSSSAEAEQRLFQAGKSRRKLAGKKGAIDAAAAAIILQSFLDSRR